MTSHEIILFLLLNLGPLILFIIAMIVIYITGSRKNERLLKEIENEIFLGLDEYTTEIKKIKIRQDEYEYRCTSKVKEMKILTIQLKMANRTFIIQKILNLLFKEKERIFIGTKLWDNNKKEDNPTYKFDIVPYKMKSFIKRRYEEFVKYDDIKTINKKIDNLFMIKSEKNTYVNHFTTNPEFIRLLFLLVDNLEHIGLQKSKDDTDPHISITYEFEEDKLSLNKKFIEMFFLVANLHLQNHNRIKKLKQKELINKGVSNKRGKAKRGLSKN